MIETFSFVRLDGGEMRKNGNVSGHARSTSTGIDIVRLQTTVGPIRCKPEIETVGYRKY